MAETLIRPATAADVPALARVQVDSWRTTYANLINADYLAALSFADKEAGWRRFFAQPDTGSRRFAVVVEQANQVCGFAVGGPNRGDEAFEAEMFALYLLDHAHGQGLGRQLFTQVAHRLGQAGFQSMLVWVLDGNPTAGFYARMGGRPVGAKTLTIGVQTCRESAYGWPDIALVGC